MSWTSPERDDQGRMSIEKMAFEIASNILIRARAPKWMYWLGLEKYAHSKENSIEIF